MPRVKRNNMKSLGSRGVGVVDTRTNVTVTLASGGAATTTDVTFASLLADFSASGRTFELKSLAVEFPAVVPSTTDSIPEHAQILIGSNTTLPLRTVAPPSRYDIVRGMTLVATATSPESKVAVEATATTIALRCIVDGSASAGPTTINVVVISRFEMLHDSLV